MDISNLIKNQGVQLEQRALNQFGAASNAFANQALSNPNIQQARRIQPTNIETSGVRSTESYDSTNNPYNRGRVADRVDGAPGVWQSSKYASDLINYAPKHRFVFKVRFIFNAPYSDVHNTEFMYLVKEIDKPKVTFEYEDVNMYNFRTKVLKGIRHEALSMLFHDDIQNKVVDFFNAYRTAYSPVSNQSYEQAALLEETGMDFYEPGGGGIQSSSMGILRDGQINVLNRIELIQIYGHGTRQCTFTFTNPRIENFDFDNLSHESNDGSGLSVSFNYDTLFVVDSETTGNPQPWGQSDILGNEESNSRSQFGNQTMGTDSIGRRSSLINNATDARGLSIDAVSSAFPQSTRNITSSARSELDSVRSTVGSAIPRINQATAGLSDSSLGDRSISDAAEFNNIDNSIDSTVDATDFEGFA
jgi:hypothetical protein